MSEKPKYTRKLKPGHLVCRWATSRNDGPDLYYNAGEGCDRADLKLLHYHFSWGRLKISGEQEPSLVEELINRGYDITTINFSIKKKTT